MTGCVSWPRKSTGHRSCWAVITRMLRRPSTTTAHFSPRRRRRIIRSAFSLLVPSTRIFSRVLPALPRHPTLFASTVSMTGGQCRRTCRSPAYHKGGDRLGWSDRCRSRRADGGGLLRGSPGRQVHPSHFSARRSAGFRRWISPWTIVPPRRPIEPTPRPRNARQMRPLRITFCHSTGHAQGSAEPGDNRS